MTPIFIICRWSKPALQKTYSCASPWKRNINILRHVYGRFICDIRIRHVSIWVSSNAIFYVYTSSNSRRPYNEVVFSFLITLNTVGNVFIWSITGTVKCNAASNQTYSSWSNNIWYVHNKSLKKDMTQPILTQKCGVFCNEIYYTFTVLQKY